MMRFLALLALFIPFVLPACQFLDMGPAQKPPAVIELVNDEAGKRPASSDRRSRGHRVQL